MNNKLLYEHGIHLLSKEDIKSDKTLIKEPHSLLGYQKARCNEGEGIPPYVWAQTFKEKVHILCPMSDKGCSQITEHPDFDLTVPCAQKDKKMSLSLSPCRSTLLLAPQQR